MTGGFFQSNAKKRSVQFSKSVKPSLDFLSLHKPVARKVKEMGDVKGIMKKVEKIKKAEPWSVLIKSASSTLHDPKALEYIIGHHHKTPPPTKRTPKVLNHIVLKELKNMKEEILNIDDMAPRARSMPVLKFQHKNAVVRTSGGGNQAPGNALIAPAPGEPISPFYPYPHYMENPPAQADVFPAYAPPQMPPIPPGRHFVPRGQRIGGSQTPPPSSPGTPPPGTPPQQRPQTPPYVPPHQRPATPPGAHNVYVPPPGFGQRQPPMPSPPRPPHLLPPLPPVPPSSPPHVPGTFNHADWLNYYKSQPDFQNRQHSTLELMAEAALRGYKGPLFSSHIDGLTGHIKPNSNWIGGVRRFLGMTDDAGAGSSSSPGQGK